MSDALGHLSRRRDPTGGEFFTFATSTICADQHLLMKQMHKPSEEKWMVVILDRNQYSPWLSCSLVDAPMYFKSWRG